MTVWNKRVPVVLALSMILIGLPPLARGDYNLQLNGSALNVTWTINAFENMTAYTHVAVFPVNLNSSLEGDNLSAFSSALQNAIMERVSSARISNLSVRISSNSPDITCTESCAPQWLNATAQFQVHEPTQTRMGIIRYDLSWKGVRMDEDLRVGNASFNTLGQTYLLKALTPFVNFPSTSTDLMRVVVNNLGVLRDTYQGVTSPIVLFDMSSLQTPIEEWSVSQDFASQLDIRTSPQVGGFSTSAVESITEPGETIHIAYVSGATVHAKISAPMNTVTQGDVLLVDLSGGFYDQILSGIILATLATLLVVLVFERQVIGGPKWTTRPKRKNR